MAQRILRKRQRLRYRTAAGPDRSEIGPLPRKSSDYIQGFYHKLNLAWAPPR